jgi:hypothetical protein
MESPNRLLTYAWYNKFERNGCIEKLRVLVGPPRVTQLWTVLALLPQLKDDSNDYMLQQDGTQPHSDMAVRNHLNAHLPRRLISRLGANDVVWCRWPSRSPDFTPCDFFIVGLHKRKSVRFSSAALFVKVKQIITIAIAFITRDTAESLGRVGSSS